MGVSALKTLEGVFVAKMFVSDEVTAKLARRGIRTYEVEQLPKNGALSRRNPHPRTFGSRFLIGPTHGGRILTVVVEPERTDEGAWHVRTAWNSSPAEQMFYYRGR